MGLTNNKSIKVIKKIGRDKGESQGTRPNRVEVFTWLLKNGMNKADTDWAKTKVLMQHYQRLGGPVGPPIVPPTLQRLKQVHSIYPSLEEFKKPKG